MSCLLSNLYLRLHWPTLYLPRLLWLTHCTIIFYSVYQFILSVLCIICICIIPVSLIIFILLWSLPSCFFSTLILWCKDDDLMLLSSASSLLSQFYSWIVWISWLEYPKWTYPTGLWLIGVSQHTGASRPPLCVWRHYPPSGHDTVCHCQGIQLSCTCALAFWHPASSCRPCCVSVALSTPDLTAYITRWCWELLWLRDRLSRIAYVR